MITENLSTLKIHKLTQAQYDRELEAGNIDPNALYLTPEEEIDMTPSLDANGVLYFPMDGGGTGTGAGGSGSSGGVSVIIQPNEPTNAGNGTLWLDTDDNYAVLPDEIGLDNTLTQAGAAADAKAVGDALANYALKSEITSILPSGGTTGQVLTIGEDGNPIWANAIDVINIPSSEEAVF